MTSPHIQNFLTKNDWKEYPVNKTLDPFINRTWYKRYDIYPRCQDNPDAPGIQIGLKEFTGIPNENGLVYKVDFHGRDGADHPICISTELTETELVYQLNCVVLNFCTAWQVMNAVVTAYTLDYDTRMKAFKATRT